MRRRALPAVLLAAMFTLVACGGGNSNETTQQAAAVNGYTSHDQLVQAATQEGEVTIVTSLEDDTNSDIAKAFEAKYPGIKVNISQEQNDGGQRVLLTLQAGTDDADLMHVDLADYKSFFPYLENINLLNLAKAGVIKIPDGMIDPNHPDVMALGSGLGAIAWNKQMLPDDQVPNTWEDFLKPQYKGQFIANIEANNIAILREAWGQDKVNQFAKDLLAQDPVWTDSDTTGLTAMVAGEHPLYIANNYHSAYRIQKKSPDKIGIKLLEPIPTNGTQQVAIRKGAKHPAAALLFEEFAATEDAQQYIDKDEPAQGSVFVPGDMLYNLTQGKQLALVTWNDFVNLDAWSKEIQTIWGFPTAQITKKK